MEYELETSATADRDFDRIPDEVAGRVAGLLRELCRSPRSVSAPACLPYPEKGMVCERTFPLRSGNSYHVAILFAYKADEATLSISGVGHGELEAYYGDDAW